MVKEPEEEQTQIEAEGGPVKSFLEHLEDLRWTLIKSGASLGVAMVFCLAASPKLIAILKVPLLKSGIPIKLETLGPMAGFVISLKVALYAGILLSLPFILYFVGEFVIPALKSQEKRYFFRAFSVGTGLFLLGITACYFWMLPLSLSAMAQYNSWLNLPSDIWRAEEYFEFATKFMLGMGLSFELPVLILTLVKLGVVKHETLRHGRRYMVIFNLVFAALVTPADILSTVLLVIPLQLLFEMCIWISSHWERSRRRAEAKLQTD